MNWKLNYEIILRMNSNEKNIIIATILYIVYCLCLENSNSRKKNYCWKTQYFGLKTIFWYKTQLQSKNVLLLWIIIFKQNNKYSTFYHWNKYTLTVISWANHVMGHLRLHHLFFAKFYLHCKLWKFLLWDSL